MCLLFLYTNDDESYHCYRLIIANNRDESWERPTNNLAWSKDGEFLCGEDRLHERKGGTWLGVSKSGKIGVVLEILDKFYPRKKRRGHLIQDFITSNISAKKCVEDRILPYSMFYRPFRLVLIDLRLPETEIVACDVADKFALLSKKQPGGIYTFDNSSPNSSWRKSAENKNRFLNIVEKYRSKNQRDQLCDELFSILTDRTRYFNDTQLRYQAAKCKMEEDIMLERSAPFVFSPKIKYGTRTHSIVTVDFEGNCEFIEKTMKSPIDPNNVEWTTTSIGFRLDRNGKTKSKL